MRVTAALLLRLVVPGCAVASLILGYIGFSAYLSHPAGPGPGPGWPDILYADLQLFVLGPPLAAGPYPLALQIARFLAPGTTILAGVETLRVLLSEQLRSWTAANAARHAIVTGDGPAALELSRQLRAKYRKVVLVSTTAAAVAQARRYGLLDVSGDPTDADTLRAAGLGRARELYACAERSTTNAATALRALEISQARGRSLTTYAQVRDAEVCGALRARRIGAVSDSRFRLDFFAIEEIAARVLLDKHSLPDPGGTATQVVIVGFGSLGQAVLREIARRHQPGSPRVRVLVQHDSCQAVLSYVDRFAAVSQACDVRTLDRTAKISLADDAPTLMLVCLPDNDEALSAGLAAAHSVADRSDRVVICMGEPTPFDSVLNSEKPLLDDVAGRLIVFDVMEEACVPDRVRADLNERLARAIHRGYVEQCKAQGESPLQNKSMLPWAELGAKLRQSNFAQAAQMGAKLSSIQCVITPESGPATDFAFTDDEIEALSKMEHVRWMQERTAQGYGYGPKRVAMAHPDLVPWALLSPEAREKDRAAVRQIPAILAQAGFRILRLPP